MVATGMDVMVMAEVASFGVCMFTCTHASVFVCVCVCVCVRARVCVWWWW